MDIHEVAKRRRYDAARAYAIADKRGELARLVSVETIHHWREGIEPGDRLHPDCPRNWGDPQSGELVGAICSRCFMPYFAPYRQSEPRWCKTCANPLLDAAASAENTKCERHFSIQDNALIKEWEGRVWCNPPYGKEIGRFVAKARGEVRHGRASLVVLLIPARTDTNWWHDHIIADADIVRFLRGRVAFEGVSKVGHNAPFPSAIVVFRKSPDAE
jgi:phage N-6-adenine-methyltransferase